MKILHAINSLGAGGAERLVLQLAKRQARDGHETRVAVLARADGALDDPGVAIVQCRGSSPYSAAALPWLAGQLRALRPDIVHAHLFPTQLHVALLAPFFPDCRFVTTEHNTFNRRRRHSALRHADRFMYARYHAVASISAATRDALNAWCPIDASQAVIANGIDLEGRSGVALRFPEPGSRPLHLATVARLEEQKGLDTLVRAMAHLPNAAVRIIGSGSLRAPLERLADSAGVSGRVDFLGYRGDVQAQLAAADLYVQPSRWEGFGIAAVEAMAAGLPVVHSDVPGLSEVVADAGVAFACGDERALAAAVERVMGTRETYERLSVRAIARARQFSVEATHHAYLGLYRGLLGDAGATLQPGRT